MARFLEVGDKELFLKYAIPCGVMLVKRGKITQEYLDSLVYKIVNKQPLSQLDAETFQVAMIELTDIATESEKTTIDSETIRKYFLELHNQRVEEMLSIKPDLNPNQCKIQTGEIIKNNLVKLPNETREIRLDFIPEAKPGDKVVVHYNFGCEILE
jgi:hypothetical protein